MNYREKKSDKHHTKAFFPMRKLQFRHTGKPLFLLLSAALTFSFAACSVKPTTQPEQTPSSQTEQPAKETPDTATQFEAYMNRMFREEAVSNTVNLHFTITSPENYGITDYEITLGDLTDQAISEGNARIENYLNHLKEFDYGKLTQKQQLTYDVLSDFLKTQLNVANLYLYDEPLKTSTGVQSQLPILFEEYAFYDEQDIIDYLQLISLTDEYFAQVIEFEKKKSEAGLFMSDFACNTIISQCRAFTANPDEHYLIKTFNKRINNFENISQEKRDYYTLENIKIVKEQVLPAFDTLAAAMTELMGSGKNSQGLCYLPEGKKYYEYLVYYNTGCSSSVAEIRDMISAERASDLKEAAVLMDQDKELWSKCNAVSLNNEDPTATLNRLKEALKSDFPAAPDTDFTVSLIDECVAEFLAPAFYVTAPIDNHNSNSIYINGDTDTTDIRYFTTLAHEGYPGHLYQTVMSYQAGLSPIRSILNYPGYIEGWATYVEMQSYFYAGLDTNIASLLQKNQSALLSLYATTDIGIHYEGWSFDDTVSFWKDYGIANANTIREIYELIIEEPAHYLKYYVGYLQFKHLKEEYSAKYPDKFSNTGFHQAVLTIGPAPFDIIKKYLDVYFKTR